MRLNISRHIYSALSGDEKIKKMVGDNLYPVATKVEKSLPLILYERDSVVSRYDKSGCAYVESEATVFVVSEGYSEGVEIADAVVSALEGKEAYYDAFSVIDCVHTGAAEGYQDKAFVQQIQFHFITFLN